MFQKGLSQEQVDAIYDHLKHRKWYSVATFGGFLKSVPSSGTLYCHAGITKYSGPAVWTYTASNSKKETTDLFYEWIFGPSSPWRTIINHDPVMTSCGVDINSIEFKRSKAYIFFPDNDATANQIVNFFTALRHLTERSTWLDRFFLPAVKLGVHPSIAFYFSMGFRSNNTNHDPFFLTGEGELTNVINGNMIPVGDGPFHKVGMNYRPYTAIWHGGDSNVQLINLNNPGWGYDQSFYHEPGVTKFRSRQKELVTTFKAGGGRFASQDTGYTDFDPEKILKYQQEKFPNVA